jgi:uncharacterized membrane protein YbhN (UPF0104 family)
LLPLISGLGATAEAVARATWWLPWWLLALEAGSFWAYGELELAVLRAAGERPSRGLVQRLTVVGSSLGKTLPGGSATATAMIIGALRAQGLSGARATAGLLAASAVSWAVLALLLPLGALLALAGGRVGGYALGAVGLAAAVLVAVVLAPVALRQPRRAGALVARGLAPLARGPLRRVLDPAQLGAVVSTAMTSASQLVRDRRALLVGGGWASANWLLDLAVLVTLAVTLGQRMPLLPVVLVYVVGQLVAAVPITPGGVGIVEATMTGLLVAAGAPAGEATAVVLGWRLVSHWLPIVVGLALLPTLALSRRRTAGRGDARGA